MKYFALASDTFVEDIWNQGQWIGILYGHCVALLVVLDKVEAPLLFVEKDRRGHW